MNRSLTTAMLYQVILAILLYLLLLITPHQLYAQEGIVIGDGAEAAKPGDRAEEPEQQYANQLYLPLIVNSETTEPACNLSAEEALMAELLTTSAEQERPTFSCNAQLSAIARSRAEDMARRAYFGHTNPDGHGPNYITLQRGYPLPAFYDLSLTGNNIESIGAGASGAEVMWKAWMSSEKHATHLLGTNAFFKTQSEYGIGFVQLPGSPYEFYWVVLSAQPG